MRRLDRRPLAPARHPGRDLNAWSRLIDLLDDEHVGGLLARIRAVGCLIGAAADIDPAQVSAAGWLVESLAEEAQRRLTGAIMRVATGKRPAGRRSSDVPRRRT